MPNKKQATFRNVCHTLWPLGIYYLITMVIGYGFIAKALGQAGFAVLESEIAQSGMLDYVWEQYIARTMEIVIYSDLIASAVFVWMYLRDLQRRKAMPRGHFQMMIDLECLMWAIPGSVALAVLCNNLIMLTPLYSMPELQETSEALAAGGLGLELLGTAVVAPIAEELMMRGLIYSRFKEITSARNAMFFSAVLFGILHGNAPQAVYALVMGLFFAWIYERSGSIAVPIAGHMAANLVVLLCEGYFTASYPVFAAVTLVCGVLTFWSVRRINCMKKYEN